MITEGIAEALDRYAAAVVAGDRAALEGILAGDYEFVSATARVIPRDRRLETLTASPRTLAALRFDAPQVRLVARAAIVRVAFTAQFLPHTGRTTPDRGVSTLVFSPDGVTWRLRHQHNSHTT